ncbi:MAG TPA: CHAT domain-containing protein, partial [Planctomycetota bacterium]|nr:CHAT domain-containing protein [Planctomycetota bacterium]
AFLRAGARVVIAARADVDLAATLELTARFHEGLRARGESPAEAMRRAREEVSALPRYADPYFWALPQVMGLGAVPLFEARAARPSRAFVVLLASGVAIVTAILAARRSRR